MKITWAILLSIAFGVAPASADKKDDARALVASADTHFKLGEFQAALDEYSKAYELYPAPPLLFNLGQCQRNLKNWDRAIFFFEGYLRKRPDAPNRAVVEDLLKEAHGELDKQDAANADAAIAAQKRAAEEAEQHRLDAEAERHRLDALAEQQRIEAAARAAEDRRLAAARAPDDHIYQKWWFWTAVGSAALVLGGTAYYFSGSTTFVEPTGSLGGLDRR